MATTHQRSRPKHSIRLDLVRVIATLMVLVLHTVLNFTIRADFFATKAWWLFEPIVAISKTSVPLFFLLSGYLTLSKSSGETPWRKTWHRLVIPWLGFNFLLLVWNFSQFRGTHLEFIHQEGQRLLSFPSSPLWYLEVMIGLYLSQPLWFFLLKKLKQRWSKLAILLSFMIAIAVTLLEVYTQQVGKILNSATAWLAFGCLYMYGGWLSNQATLKQPIAWVALIIIGIISIITGDYYSQICLLNGYSCWWSGYTNLYLSIPVILTSIGIFQSIISFPDQWIPSLFKTELNKKVVSFLAESSYGIYLIHVLVIAVISTKLSFDTAGLNVYLYNLVNYGLVLSVSILLTTLIRKNPYLKKVVGE